MRPSVSTGVVTFKALTGDSKSGFCPDLVASKRAPSYVSAPERVAY
jgi:hypothetical protein